MKAMLFEGVEMEFQISRSNVFVFIQALYYDLVDGGWHLCSREIVLPALTVFIARQVLLCRLPLAIRPLLLLVDR